MEIWIYIVNGEEVFGWEFVWKEPNSEVHHRLFDSGPRYASADEAKAEAQRAQDVDTELAKIPIANDLVDRML